jgi:hypothetical protein
MRVFFASVWGAIALVAQDGRECALGLATDDGHLREWCYRQESPSPEEQQVAVRGSLTAFFEGYEQVELLSARPDDDWALLCRVFGGENAIPSQLTAPPIDLSAVLTRTDSLAWFGDAPGRALRRARAAKRRFQ